MLYEIGFSSQSINPDTKELEAATWDWTKDLLHKKIDVIVDEAGADKPLLFFTNTRRINRMLNRERKREEKPPVPFVPNFREEVAKEKEYKGGRKNNKPIHFYNLLANMLSHYETRVHEGGLEADDYICVTQYKSWQDRDTIICSRDKDLRQCPGLFYSWEVGKQASIGPMFVEPLGHLELIHKTNAAGKKQPPKLFGTGHKFFYAQLLVGDAVDNIGGVKGRGPVFAYELLSSAETERQLYELTAEKYVQAWGDNWKTKMREQADLLWMIRELDEQGNKVGWKPPIKEA